MYRAVRRHDSTCGLPEGPESRMGEAFHFPGAEETFNWSVPLWLVQGTTLHSSTKANAPSGSAGRKTSRRLSQRSTGVNRVWRRVLSCRRWSHRSVYAFFERHLCRSIWGRSSGIAATGNHLDVESVSCSCPGDLVGYREQAGVPACTRFGNGVTDWKGESYVERPASISFDGCVEYAPTTGP